MHSITSSARARARALGLAAAIVFSGCGTSASTVTTLTYEPGDNIVRQQGLDVELLIAEYGERQLTLRVAFSNPSGATTTIDREGILLSYGELEFPVSEDAAEHALPPTVTLAPGQQRELWLGFETGSRVTDEAELKLRAVRHEGRHAEVLVVPLQPPVMPEEQGRERDA